MSEALRLATAPGAVIPVDIETTSMLAAELRRLHALNAELLEALKMALAGLVKASRYGFGEFEEEKSAISSAIQHLEMAEQPALPLGDSNPGLQWDKTPQAFNDWWDSDYDPTGNPYRKDSAAYWAWAGWKAATEQPSQQHIEHCIWARNGHQPCPHVQPAQQPTEADELIRNLGFGPEQFRTEAGFINHMKLRAAIKHPDEYQAATHPMYQKLTNCVLCGRLNLKEGVCDHGVEQPAQQHCLQDLWHKVWPESGAFVRASAEDLTKFAKAVSAYPQPAQPSKPWVGLTDVEWMNIVNKDHAWFGQRPEEVAHEVAKLVEAKLREKNS